MMLRWIIKIGCLALTQGLLGQATFSIDSTEMLIGDQRIVTLQVSLINGAEWVNRDVELSDTISQIQTIKTVDLVDLPIDNGRMIQKQWIIAPFDTGLIYIPGLPIIIKQNGETDAKRTNNIPIMVRGVEADSTGLAPIKSIFEEGVHWIDFLAYYIILLVGLLSAGAYYLWKNRKVPEAEVIVIERPAHELAIQALDELDREQLWQKGEIKPYHSKLTHIFREYLEKRFGINALESTTSEIRHQLTSVGLENDKRQKSIELLQLSDLVKFAKATPRVEVHAELMQYVREFIYATKSMEPIVSQNEEEE